MEHTGLEKTAQIALMLYVGATCRCEMSDALCADTVRTPRLVAQRMVFCAHVTLDLPFQAEHGLRYLVRASFWLAVNGNAAQLCLLFIAVSISNTFPILKLDFFSLPPGTVQIALQCKQAMAPVSLRSKIM